MMIVDIKQVREGNNRNATHMLVGEEGMLLGLFVPKRTMFADKPGASGGSPDGNPACGCGSLIAGAIGLSGFVACLDGLVGVAFGTFSVAEVGGDAINVEGETRGTVEFAGDANELGGLPVFASED
jgi:hypothetical protein